MTKTELTKEQRNLHDKLFRLSGGELVVGDWVRTVTEYIGRIEYIEDDIAYFSEKASGELQCMELLSNCHKLFSPGELVDRYHNEMKHKTLRRSSKEWDNHTIFLAGLQSYMWGKGLPNYNLTTALLKANIQVEEDKNKGDE